MPTKVDRIPGAWSKSLPWAEMADGNAWCISEDEMRENGTKLETVRVYAHEYAKSVGGKFRTKTDDGDLYLQFTSN